MMIIIISHLHKKFNIFFKKHEESLVFFSSDRVHKIMDSVNGIEKLADGAVAVHGIDDISNVFCHINGCVPRAFIDLGIVLVEVWGNDLINDSVFVCFVDLCGTGCKET